MDDDADLDNISADGDILLDKIFKKSNDLTSDVDDIMLSASMLDGTKVLMPKIWLSYGSLMSPLL